MKVRAIRESDPVYGTGDNNFVHDKEAVATLLNTRLKTFKAEIKRDVSFGLSDFKNLNKEDLDIDIGEIILDTTGVEEILEFNSTQTERDYSGNIIVSTNFGELEVSI